MPGYVFIYVKKKRRWECRSAQPSIQTDVVQSVSKYQNQICHLSSSTHFIRSDILDGAALYNFHVVSQCERVSVTFCEKKKNGYLVF